MEAALWGLWTRKTNGNPSMLRLEADPPCGFVHVGGRREKKKRQGRRKKWDAARDQVVAKNQKGRPMSRVEGEWFAYGDGRGKKGTVEREQAAVVFQLGKVLVVKRKKIMCDSCHYLWSQPSVWKSENEFHVFSSNCTLQTSTCSLTDHAI